MGLLVAMSSWGFWVSLTADIFIAVGLTLQKRAINDLQAAGKSADITALARSPMWLSGQILSIVAEVGNLAAYGDVNTPTAVVASLGCVGVIFSWAFALLFLGEAFRWRDVAGVITVVIGVVSVVLFVPKKQPEHGMNYMPCPFWYQDDFSFANAPAGAVPEFWYPGTGADCMDDPRTATGRDVCTENLLACGSAYWYVWQPMWLIYFSATVALFVAAFTRLLARGPEHPFSFLILSDLAGGWTVSSAVLVSAFVGSYAIGEGKLCAPRAIRRRAQFVGAQFGAASFDRASAALRYALVEPIFWVMLIILVSTAIFQVVYLNKALENYPSTLVIPLHYVLFTIFSITGPSILYQELTLDPAQLPLPPPLMMGLFVGGILMTFLGVATLSSGHGDDDSAIAGEPISPPARWSTASGEPGAPRRPRAPSLMRGYSVVVPVFVPQQRIWEPEQTTRSRRASTSEAMGAAAAARAAAAGARKPDFGKMKSAMY